MASRAAHVYTRVYTQHLQHRRLAPFNDRWVQAVKLKGLNATAVNLTQS